MKALITAGGRGTRLRPITYTRNKHLMPIANKPLIFRAIEDIAALGIRDIAISINAGDTEVPTVVGDGGSFGVSITYIEQDEPRGLAHVLQLGKNFIGDDEFIFYYGDNALAGGLHKHLAEFNKYHSDCHLCLSRVEHPEQFGIALVEGDKVIKTVEKPQQYLSDLAITGIQFYNASIFEAIKHIKPTPPKPPRMIAEMDIPPANQWLIDNGYNVSYSEITGWWKDTGKPRDLLAASRLVLDSMEQSIGGEVDESSSVDGRVVIEQGAQIKNSVIRGPAIIGAGSVIEDSFIGPFTSIGAQSTIIRTEIEFSIILEKCYIADLQKRLEGSILGEGVRITLCEIKPTSTTRLIVGDQSVLELP
jgi:glucose-1-phosphate thymidylyltransferase